jgi:hypothetical protein
MFATAFEEAIHKSFSNSIKENVWPKLSASERARLIVDHAYNSALADSSGHLLKDASCIQDRVIF